MSAAGLRRPAWLRLLGGLSMLMVAVAVLGGAHGYLARRLVLDPQLPDGWRQLALGAIGLLFVGMFLQPVVERRLPLPWSRYLSWPFVVWMGVLWIGTVVLLAGDGLVWLLGARSSGSELSLARSLAGLSAVGIACASGLALRAGLRAPAVRRVELALQRWPGALDGFRIVQISDLHIGPVRGRRFAQALVERVNGLEPDLVAITGDLVDGKVAQLAQEVAPFAGLRAPHGVYFVTGNHDFYSGAEAWVQRVRELGIRVLRNERVTLGKEDALFELAGVEDHHGDWLDGTREDLDASLRGRDPSRPVVLLAHDPSTFLGACKRGVDLQLSGHTHGGQIWPFGALVRLAVPFVAGLYRRGSSLLYVSRGTGFWGPPMRLAAPSEITEVRLRRAAEPEASVPLGQTRGKFGGRFSRKD